MNVGIGSILGGVGAVINKDPDQRVGPVFLKGLGQGALGGYLVFESKRLVREFSKTGDYNYVWPSKIVNSAGTSIIENAAANRDFWARWHLNIGFNRLEVDTKDNFRLSYRIMPLDLLATGYQSINAKADWELSFYTGTFVFRKDDIGRKKKFAGTAFGNSIVLRNDIYGNLSLPHEIIHIYQYEQFSAINSILINFETQIPGEMINLEKYHTLFYTDYNLPFFGLLYLISNPKNDHSGIFEKEADYYGHSTNIGEIILTN
jgi:hypothetical protein